MHPCICQEVVKHLPQLFRVSGDLRPVRMVKRDLVTGAGSLSIHDRQPDKLDKVYFFQVQRPALVEPSQQEQVLDQVAHPRSFRLNSGHDPLNAFRRAGRAATVEFRIPANRCKRRAQLVRRVCDEPAQAPFGSFLGRERGLDLGEHVVQRLAKLSDLAGCIAGVHPAREVSAANQASRRDHRVDRSQAMADGSPDHPDQQHEHDQACYQDHESQVANRFVYLRQGSSGDVIDVAGQGPYQNAETLVGPVRRSGGKDVVRVVSQLLQGDCWNRIRVVGEPGGLDDKLLPRGGHNDTCCGSFA